MKERNTISRDVYKSELNKLSELMRRVKNTPFSIYAKVIALITMNMRYEKVAFNMNLKEHPYILTSKIIKDAATQFENLMDISFIESDDDSIKNFKSSILEEKHRELWQEIWSRHNEKEFQEFINLKATRLDINHLAQYIKGKDCVDVGCGNGSFAFALLERGAKSVTGLDFGKKSIKYAQWFAEKQQLKDKAFFKVANVFDTGLPSNSFGFAVSNGVFHHLREEEVRKALKEVARVLEPEGRFWYYVDGKNAISMDLWDKSVEILKQIDILFIENILDSMNVKRNKIVHLMDGLSATYLHTTWDEVTALLSECGFGNFSRLKGGMETDFDLDKIESDPFGKEKFGEGDLRILCQLLEDKETQGAAK